VIELSRGYFRGEGYFILEAHPNFVALFEKRSEIKF